MMNTLSDILLSAAGRFSPRAAVIEDGMSVTYGDLVLRARSFASFLSSRGIKKGDRVAIFLPNSIELVTAVFVFLALVVPQFARRMRARRMQNAVAPPPAASGSATAAAAGAGS